VTAVGHGGHGPRVVEQGAKMTVAWANAYKGGLGGHPFSSSSARTSPLRLDGRTAPTRCAEARRRRDRAVTAQDRPSADDRQGGIPYMTVRQVPPRRRRQRGVLADRWAAGRPGSRRRRGKAKGYKKFAMLTVKCAEAIQPAETLG